MRNFLNLIKGLVINFSVLFLLFLTSNISVDAATPASTSSYTGFFTLLPVQNGKPFFQYTGDVTYPGVSTDMYGDYYLAGNPISVPVIMANPDGSYVETTINKYYVTHVLRGYVFGSSSSTSHDYGGISTFVVYAQSYEMSGLDLIFHNTADIVSDSSYPASNYSLDLTLFHGNDTPLLDVGSYNFFVSFSLSGLSQPYPRTNFDLKTSYPYYGMSCILSLNSSNVFISGTIDVFCPVYVDFPVSDFLELPAIAGTSSRYLSFTAQSVNASVTFIPVPEAEILDRITDANGANSGFNDSISSAGTAMGNYDSATDTTDQIGIINNSGIFDTDTLGVFSQLASTSSLFASCITSLWTSLGDFATPLTLFLVLSVISVVIGIATHITSVASPPPTSETDSYTITNRGLYKHTHSTTTRHKGGWF